MKVMVTKMRIEDDPDVANQTKWCEAIAKQKFEILKKVPGMWAPRAWYAFGFGYILHLACVSL